MCVNKRQFVDNMKIYEKPKSGLQGMINTVYFHLNGCLPFYNRTIQKVQPNIIHAHFGFDGYRMIKPTLKNDIPFITSFYGSDVSRLPTEFDWSRRYRKLAKACDAFIAISHHMKTRLIELGFPKNKITVIPFGINLNHFTYSNEKPKEKTVMMVGRLVEKKGFIYGLKAVKLLKKQDIDIQLDLYGSGPLEAKLKRTAQQLEINNQIKFHGYVSNSEILDALKEHQVLLVPSVTAADGDQEGLPNTILEAMAAGTPVVASNHSAISEAIEPHKTGLLTSERDAEAIAKALEIMINNKQQTEKMRKNARRYIEKNHNITDIIKQTETLYQKVISQ